MKKAVVNFFYRVGLDDEDIAFITSSYPELDNLDENKIIGNAKLVVDAGYPIDELEFLILINPGFLISNTETLREILDELGDNAYMMLKDDPFII